MYGVIVFTIFENCVLDFFFVLLFLTFFYIDVEMSEDVEMQDKPEKIYNSRTLLDKNGSYPKWLNQRAMKKLKKKQLKNMKKK